MKLGFTLVERIKEMKCSKNEINFIIYVAEIQQETGTAYNVYYKDVVSSLGISTKTFYNILNNLEQKEILSYSSDDRDGFHNITLLNNDFSQKDFNEGYININRAAFHSEEFKKLKASEKYVLFKVLKRNQDDYKNIPCSAETIAQYAGINRKNVKLIFKIIEDLKTLHNEDELFMDCFVEQRNKKRTIFHIKINPSKRINSPMSKKYNVPHWESTSRKFYMYEAFCKKYHLNLSQKDILDLVQMDNQYNKYMNFFALKTKEILLQYKNNNDQLLNGQMICATIRKVVDPVFNRFLVNSPLKENLYFPIY